MTRFAIISLVALVIGGMLSGCAGSRRHYIDTGGNGSLQDALTIPEDGDYSVSTNVWVKVYWPDGTEPPPKFSFALRDESDTRIYTKMHSGDEPYEWWFEPIEELDHDSRYKIQLKTDSEYVRVYFFTVEEPFAMQAAPARPKAGAPISGPALEHTIRTAP